MGTTGYAMAAGWYVDPTTRHAYRYWDGTKWTETVSDEDVPVQDSAAVAAPDPARQTETMLQNMAMACVTPAQMARTFGLPTTGLDDVLEGQVGIKVSRGARRGATYTKRDVEVFDEAAKSRFLDALLASAGRDKLLSGANSAQWWETLPGGVADNVLEFVDHSAEHVSTRRRPIRKRDFVLGVLGLTLGAFVFIPFAWLSWYSWEAWREGKVPRPKGAVVWGWAVAVGCAGAVAFGLVNAVAQLAAG